MRLPIRDGRSMGTEEHLRLRRLLSHRSRASQTRAGDRQVCKLPIPIPERP